MAKSVHDDVLDAALEFIADNCDKITVCSNQPTSYAEGNATYALADASVTPGAGNGDFTIANGDVSGRKLTIGAQADLLIDASGTAGHIALLDTANSKLLYVTTCDAAALVANASNTVSIPAWDIEIADPS